VLLDFLGEWWCQGVFDGDWLPDLFMGLKGSDDFRFSNMFSAVEPFSQQGEFEYVGLLSWRLQRHTYNPRDFDFPRNFGHLNNTSLLLWSSIL